MSTKFVIASTSRTTRQELIPGWNQDRLAKARVVVAGAGAIGNEVLKLLALMGFGEVVVLDFDTISFSNLSRTVLFREEDVGRPKAQVARERALALNPDMRITAIDGDVGRDIGLGALADADLIIGGLDNIRARWMINRRAMLAGIPWIDGGISHDQVQVTRYVPGNGACYECTFTPSMYERFDARRSCTGLQKALPDAPMPTTAVGASIVAALQVQDAVNYLHDPVSGMAPGHRFTFMFNRGVVVTDRLRSSENCDCHEAITRPDLIMDHGPLHLSASDLAEAAGADGAAEVALGWDLIESLTCPACETVVPIGRPAASMLNRDAVCGKCGTERFVELRASLSAKSSFWEEPLASLGVADHEVLRVTGERAGGTWVRLGGTSLWETRVDHH